MRNKLRHGSGCQLSCLINGCSSQPFQDNDLFGRISVEAYNRYIEERAVQMKLDRCLRRFDELEIRIDAASDGINAANVGIDAVNHGINAANDGINNLAKGWTGPLFVVAGTRIGTSHVLPASPSIPILLERKRVAFTLIRWKLDRSFVMAS